MTRLLRALPYIIAANIVLAMLLLVAGDATNAMLGLAGAGCFGLALMLTERTKP